ncbi:LytR family transcriptional regulator [Micromonospora sp. KC606]|uniref:LCP family protein n=1 Tax=Micromonospora sp. KC606 TaxID=2530379 RepID=UPI0010492376|nr:LCP family protein [Micromonospora sp. KC606]TDC76038.1 LytR family transcriptional regulator [Micromonospora sp. KC606]
MREGQQPDEPDPVEPAESPSEVGSRQPRRPGRGRRIALVTLLALALLGAGGAGAAAFYLRSVEKKIDRVDAFTEVPQEKRPPVVAKDAMNIMILGSDSRDPENSGSSRSDTIILVHLPADRKSAQLISIPRDTWLPVPRSGDGRHGGREAKINAAFAWGGVPLMVRTVELFTGVRVDHVAVVDFAGFKEIVDALGGIEIDVEQGFTSTHSLSKDGRRTFVPGRQTLDGDAALDYARERYAFADGDFARIRHQQQVIKAILDKAASGGVLTNPGKLNAFLEATANAVSVDRSMSIFSLATELRHLRGGNLAFFTCPTRGTGRVGSESVVFVDKPKAKTFFDAVRRDAVADIVRTTR